jgi:hypothetical protein
MIVSSYPDVLNTQSIYSADWQTQVGRGKIPGVTNLNFNGYQGNLGTTFMPVWDANTTYTYPVSASTMLLYSTSASDTALQIRIEGLDASYNALSETITLTNGTTGVTTANSYFRIQSISIVTTSSNNPVGNIILGNAGKTAIYAQLNDGNGRSNMTLYTVPAGYTFYLTQVNAFSDQKSNAVTYYRSYTRSPTGITNIIRNVPFTISYLSTRVTPRPYPEKSDIQWQCASSATSAVGLQIEGLLIANTAP